MNELRIEFTINLDNYEFDKEKEQQLREDILWDTEEGLDRAVKCCIRNLNKTKGMLEQGWIFAKDDGSIWIVKEVSELGAIICKFPDMSDSYRISAYTSVELISDGKV